MYVWGILAGSAVGLLASTMGRLYASAFYALRDTRTPLRFAVVRVLLTGALGWFAALQLPEHPRHRPAVGRGRADRLGRSGGVGGVLLLRRGLRSRVGATGLPPGLLPRLWASAAAGAGLGVGGAALSADLASRADGGGRPRRVRSDLSPGRPSLRRTGGARPAGAAMSEPLTNSVPLARKLDTLPDGPGVYLWKDAAGAVIYVGKAKRLRSRVRSYFLGDHAENPKSRLLVKHIADVETIVVPDEVQSLLLENNLIKTYQPRFNVRLKDDKSYPSIAVTVKDPFPRVLVTRRMDIPGARYFGPYTDVTLMRRSLALIRRMFTVRSCSDDLPRERRERPCLDFHIGRCRAPCVGWQDEASYRAMIDDVVDFLGGRTVDVRSQVRDLMTAASDRQDYERARELRDTLKWLDRAETPAAVEVTGTGDADVIGYARDGDDAVGVLMRIREGRLIGREHRVLENVDEVSDPEVLGALLVRYYLPAEGRADRLVLPMPPADFDQVETSLARCAGAGAAAGDGGAMAGTRRPERDGTCSRVSASSRSKPTSGRRTRSTRWDATSD